jgi:hypothetical protein
MLGRDKHSSFLTYFLSGLLTLTFVVNAIDNLFFDTTVRQYKLECLSQACLLGTIPSKLEPN